MEAFFLTLGALIGAVFVIVFSRPAYRSLLPGEWQPVTGKVIRAVVEETQGTDSSTHFNVRVDYEYPHGARVRQGSAFVGHGRMGRHDALELANSYPDGKALPVFVYQPDPTETRLSAGVNVMACVAVLFGLAFVVFAVHRGIQLA